MLSFDVNLSDSDIVKFIQIKDPYAEDDVMIDVDQIDTAPVVVVPAQPHNHTLSDLREKPLVSTPTSNSATSARPSPSHIRSLIEAQRTYENPMRKSVSTFGPTASSPASTAQSRTLPSPLTPYASTPTPTPYSSTPAISTSTPNTFPETQYRTPRLSYTNSPQPWSSSSARSSPFNGNAKFIPPSITDPVETDPEVLFLFRHYTKVVGFSMDLFDCGRFFSDYVPTRAMYNPLLKNACCAYAAKQLAMVRGQKLSIGSIFSRPALTEYWPNTGTDWLKVATKYYDEAIHLLLQAVDLVNQDQESGDAWQEGMSHAGKSDDLMAATAILCEYEAIDSSGDAWHRHLMGTKSLLDIAEAGMRPLDHIEISQRKPRFSRARRAIFWNFARQDFAAALITESPARLDVNNHQLWRDAGLELDSNGRIIPSRGTWIEYSEGGLAMREDMISNGLILILSKICNYLSNAESLEPPPPGISARDLSQYGPNMPYYGLSQQVLLHRWTLLSNEVEDWKTCTPDTFKPIGRSRSANGLFEEIWYSVGMCAAAMANYHMARILLLINKPQESTMTRSTVSSRIGEYRAIVPECEYHGREIVGIAMARPETAVRIFLILPLFFAGQIFQTLHERLVVIDVLRSIEKDLGWATEYRVQTLLTIWGYDESLLATQNNYQPPSSRVSESRT